MDERRFIQSVIGEAQPPQNPLVRKQWAGLAFDRNRHEELAPSSVWKALLDAHQDSYGGEISILYSDAHGLDVVERIEPTLEVLLTKFDAGLVYAKEFFLVSSGKNWLARIDYDVCLFVGLASFIRNVVEHAGGLGYVRKLMVDDFYAGSEQQPGGLDQYIAQLIEPLVQP